MLAEFIKTIFDRATERRPITTTIGAQTYKVNTDGSLGEPVRPVAPIDKPTLNLRTVRGLVAAFKAHLDEFPAVDVAFHVTSPTSVDLVTMKADEYGRRHIFATAKHSEDSGFKFGEYYTPEDFIIAFRAGFMFNDMAVKVQQLCSSLTAESGVSVADDGISQSVTVKVGSVIRNAVELPNEIPLIPWRTFREVAPVQEKFLLRMKSVKDSLPRIALHEIDGKWKLDTITSVAEYIADALPQAAIIA